MFLDWGLCTSSCSLLSPLKVLLFQVQLLCPSGLNLSRNPHTLACIHGPCESNFGGDSLFLLTCLVCFG